MSGRQAKRERRRVAAVRKELVRGISGEEAAQQITRLQRIVKSWSYR